MRILIVDDLEENLYLLEILLKENGYKVIPAKNGVEALSKLRKESIDLIISDILMPRMDGFQLCRECKKDESLKKIPFIFYTATYTDKEDEKFALGLGAERFIIKPQEPDIFIKILKEVIEEYKEGILIAPQEPIQAEETYLSEYNKRLIEKLEKKVLDLKEANKGLREKKEKIYKLQQFQRNVIDNANIWINMLDNKANVTVWNKVAEKISGYSAQEVIGHSKIWEWLYPDEEYRKEITIKAVAIIEKGEAEEDFETTIRCKDGKVKIISWNSRNLTDSQGEIIGSISIGRDITEYKQVEQAMLENEKRYRELFTQMSSGVIIYEAKGNGRDFIIKNINPAAEKIDKLKKEDVLGKSILKVFPGVKHFDPFKALQKIYKTGKPQRLTISLYKDQRIVGWRENYIYRLPSGEIVAVYDDITDRRLAEKELKDSEERLKILFDYAPDTYYINDLKGKFVDGNKAAEKLTGYKREELIGKSFLKLKLLSLNDIPRAAKMLANSLRGLPIGPDEFVLNRKDNSKIIVEISTYPVKIKGKTLVLGIARDITKRKKAEIALAESEEKYRTVFENTGTAMIIIEEDMTISVANRQVEQLSGYSKEEIENKIKWMELVIPEDLERIKEYHLLRLKEKGSTPISYEFSFRDKLGGVKSIWLKIGMIPGTKKSVISLTDITDRKTYEGKLKKSIEDIIYTIGKITETRDPYTSGHQLKVSKLSTAIAQEMKLPPDKIEGIRIASLVHDIGKISIPSEILSKPSKLSEIEYRLIENHSQIGYDILKSIEFSWPIAQIVLQHQERLNGSGYPQGLKGDDILLEAKIIAVADVIEAMSSHRPYRPALGINKALEEIFINRGILYVPEVVDACIKLFKEKDFKF
jgi:PAS domain S-box-containing protein